MLPSDYANYSINRTSVHRTTSELFAGALTLCTIIIMTIVGNGFVIAAIFTYRPLKKVQNFFLVSLACADLTVAVTVMPFHVVKFLTLSWPFGHVMCQLWLTLDIWLCTASIFNLCVIALDRYWAIHDPVNYAKRRTFYLVSGLIGLAWLISALISVPPLLGWNDWSQKSLQDSCTYTTEEGFVVYSACGSFYVPLAVMTVVYVRIFMSARERLRTRRNRAKLRSLPDMKPSSKLEASPAPVEMINRDPSGSVVDLKFPDGGPNAHSLTRTQSKMKAPVRDSLDCGHTSSNPLRRLSKISVRSFFPGSRRTTVASLEDEEELNSSMAAFFKKRERISITKEKKAAKTLAIIMGVFVLCWLPFFTLYLLAPFCENCIHAKVFEAANWLGYINSSLNPIIYTIFNLDFRRGFQRIFHRLLPGPLGRWCSPKANVI